MLTIEGRGICNNYTWQYGIINDKVVVLVNQMQLLLRGREGPIQPTELPSKQERVRIATMSLIFSSSS